MVEMLTSDRKGDGRETKGERGRGRDGEEEKEAIDERRKR